MKKILREATKVIFVFLFLIGTCFGLSASAAELDELPGNAIAIQTPEELNMICNEYPADGYYYLACDIDMTQILSEYGDMYHEGKCWEPIGTSSLPFSGTFDGRGNKITGLKINRTTAYNGLFGYADDAVIKNLIIQEGNVTGGNYTAMLLGKGINTILTDCTIDDGIVLSSGSYVAGIAGVLTEETGVVLDSCSNSASVTGATCVAGCVASVTGTSYNVENCFNSGNIVATKGELASGGVLAPLGGIVGDASSGTIVQCVNDGTLESSESKSYQAGGIAGRAKTVEECMNNGTIIVSLGNRGTTESYVGGIVGNSTIVKKCVNQGTVTGKGGIKIISGLSPTGSTSWQKEVDVYAYVAGVAAKAEKISECYNWGKITENTKNSYRGAIIAYSSGNIENCFSNNDKTPLAVGGKSLIVTNCYNVGGIIASSGTATNCYYYAETESGIGELRTKRQLRIKNTFTDWDFENVWTMEGNEDYLYPELSGMKPEYEKSVVSISMSALPTKTNYLEGKENLDLTGAEIRVTYDNETTEKIAVTDEMISGFDNTKVGENVVTVSYGGYMTTFTVTVLAKSLERIEVTTLPNKLEYLEVKDSLNVSGGILTLYYNNDTTAKKTLTTDMVSGFDNTRVGNQELTVTYGGKTTTYDVTIIEKTLERIAVTKLPTKTSYIEAKETLNLSGGKITLYYDNDQTKVIDLSEATVTGFNNQVVGTQTLTVYYEDFSATFQVQITAKTVSNIAMESKPAKLSYLEAKDQLDVSGGQVRIIYNNDTEEVIDLTKSMVYGFDNTVVGTQTLTVKYGGKTTSYTVQIIGKSLTGIAWKTKPTKLTYLESKDTLDVTGGKLTLNYNNGTSEVISMTKSMVTGFNNTRIGVQTLVVSYGGYQLTYDVEILQKSLSYIAVTTLPKKTTYLEAKEELNITGGKLTLYYDNNTQSTIGLVEEMVRGFDNTKVGAQVLTVSYDGKTTTFTVEIIEKQPVKVVVESMPEKLVYEENEVLNLSSGKLLVTYDNGQSEVQEMTQEMISGFDSSRGGKLTLTITYGNVTTQIEVEILHNYQVAVTEPTCEKGGYSTYTCIGCGDSYVDDEVDELGHDYDTVVTEPTCENDGYSTHTCGTCGDSYVDEEKEKLGHSYDTVVTDPTCEDTGYSTHTCETCGDSYVDDEKEALGHKLGEWFVVTAPTCEEIGEQKRECIRCEYDESKDIPEIGHSYDTVVTAPTCEDAGYSTHTCGNCGDSYVDSEEAALGHDYDTVVTEATCEDDGYSTHTCVTCGDTYVDEEVGALGHSFINYVTDENVTEDSFGTKTAQCDRCEETDTVIDYETGIPVISGNYEVTRLYGSNRYETGYKVADTLKAKLGVEKFDAVVIATGKNFADALSGSYLAVVKNAPIILTNGKSDNISTLHKYIKMNVAEGGMIYILGGENAVPSKVAEIDGYEVMRLAGKSRYETNFAILEEAGIQGDDLIVATGKTFADSLSASAVKKPILLVKPREALNEEQRKIVEMVTGGNIYIIGGTSAVSKEVEMDLENYGTVVRVAGKSRYETSVEVARTFFESIDEAVVASGKNFPDGLCGGVLAAAMDVPLVLTANDKTEAAGDYLQLENVMKGYVLGGTGALKNKTIVEVFHLGDW